jgi:hypothetical protein
MIIDADCHISPTFEGGNSIKTDELLRRMDRSGVEKAVVWLQPPYMREVADSNRYVCEAMKNHPDRILGFGWVDPHLGVDRMKDEVKRCTDEYGLYGVKMNGAQNNYYIDDPKMGLPLIETIAATGKVLAFHIGADAFEQTHPYRMGKIAKMFPDTKMLMIHTGGVGFKDLSNAAIEVVLDNPNITAIGSAIRPINVLKALKTFGADRLCYGSDTPFNLMHVEVAAFHALMDGEFNDDEKHMIMAGNIARVLDISI